MKKFIFSFAVLTATIFASCSKDADLVTPSTDDYSDVNLVAITLTSESDTTRATPSASATTWEKSISSLTLFAFDASQSLVLRREFTASELTAKAASVALPKSMANSQCTFYVVANGSVSTIANYSSLLASMELDASQYNGTYSEVSTSSKRSLGFVMSGTSTTTIGSVNTITSVPITIKRTVAKVSMSITLDDVFAEKYPSSTLTYNSVTLSKAASQSPIISSVISTGAMSYSHTQATGAGDNYLFYIFENGALSSGSRVTLELNTTFDLDGSASSIDDRTEVLYTIELSGSGTGEILRNGYYYIDANIRGLVGQDCDIAITVADWETPVTQSVDLGL